jgi:hypothetical protein
MLLCMTAPLERLKSYKDVVGEWKRDSVYQQAFDGIRDALRRAITLQVFDENASTITYMTCDAIYAWWYCRIC